MKIVERCDNLGFINDLLQAHCKLNMQSSICDRYLPVENRKWAMLCLSLLLW